MEETVFQSHILVLEDRKEDVKTKKIKIIIFL